MRDMLIAISFCSMLILIVFAGMQRSQIQLMQKTVTNIEKRMNSVTWTVGNLKAEVQKKSWEWQVKLEKQFYDLGLGNNRIDARLGATEGRLRVLEAWKMEVNPEPPDESIAYSEDDSYE